MLAVLPALFLLQCVAGESFSDCDPLVPENCLFPFPNDFFARNASTKTGKRIHFGLTTLPASVAKQKHIDPSDWNALDGFPVIPNILTYFSDVVLGDDVPTHMDVGKSLLKTSPTIIVNARTGELVPHWAELDNSTDLPTAERAMLMWPAYHLEESTPYIVAMRNLKTSSGSLIEPSEAFKALRDDTPTKNYDIEGRRDLYMNIFNKLAEVGVARPTLQLAWQFTTASRAATTERLVHMRDDATQRLPEGGPEFVVLRTKSNYSQHIHTMVTGEMMVPLYCTSAFPGAELVFGPDGLPAFQRFVPVTFSVMIPRSLVTNGTTGRIMQYGHGLFGSQNEVESGYLQQMADDFGYVMVAVDWWGLAAVDEPAVVEMMATDLGRFRIVPDRCAQGITNQLMAMKLMMGSFGQSTHMTFNGKSVVDPERRAYFGNSEGGILGGVYMALSQDVTRGVLGVSGAPYSLLLPRSADFSTLFKLLKARFVKSLDRIQLMSIFQMQWDRAEPSGFVTSISKDLLPNTPHHTIVLHYGLGDAQVNWLGAHTEGRSIGCKMFNNNVHYENENLFGFDFIAGPVTNQSMIVGWDFGVPKAPDSNIPPSKKTDTHERPRRDPRAQEQLHHFFETGIIKDTCNGKGCHEAK